MSRGKRKKLGQHFLVDEVIAERIVEESKVGEGDRALEVGPGNGVLTRLLVGKGALVRAVELDKTLFDKLNEEMKGAGGFSIEWGNALRFDFDSIEAPYHVVSNLPYSVAVALIKKFFEHLDRIASMTLMLQAEVAGRLAAKPGESGYGSLSIFTAYHCTTEYLFSVPNEAFRPRPKVESAVLRLEPCKTPPVAVSGKDDFFRFVHASFRHRRKTIRNNLRKLWADAGSFDESCRSAGVDPQLRPQDISMEQYASLYRRWEMEGMAAGL